MTNCSGRLLSRPSFTLTCSMASFVAAFPAKYAAGSPGRARMRQNVTTTTPASPGAAAASRLETSRRKDRRIRSSSPRCGRGAAPSALGQLAEVQLDVEPVLVANDVLLHGHVEVDLDEGQPRHVAHRELLHLAHVLRVLLLVRLE